MLGQFTWEQQTDCCLDLSAGDGGSLVVVCKTRRFGSNALENVVDKAVHDAHGFSRNTGVGVDLLHDLVDVDAVAFPPPPLPLLVPGSYGLCLGHGLLGSLASCFGWHA